MQKFRIRLLTFGLVIIFVGVAIVYVNDVSSDVDSVDISRQRPEGTEFTGFDSEEEQPRVVDPLIPPLQIADRHTELTDHQFGHDLNATFHPHGVQVCATGCAVSNHPNDVLDVETFRNLIAEFAREHVTDSSPALAALLFYGQQTVDLLESDKTVLLDERRRQYLEQQLGLSHVRVSIRIVDEQGVVRAACSPTRVPMHRRHVFSLDGNNLQPLVASGTVKRVGLNRLWTRL